MSFLAPLFLAAIGAVSLPILLHLIRRTPRGRVLFSSLMFLSPSPPRVTKRSRLEHWLLLALRALAIVLIACAFARPFLWDHATADAEEGGPGRRIAILIDTSASMQREDLWNQAVAAAKQAAADANSTDAIALLAFDRRVNRVVSFEQWSSAPVALRPALINDALAKLAPGHAATHLGDALIAAADALNESDSPAAAAKAFTGERHIVLITDLQQGSQIQSLGAYDWPVEVRVKLAPVAAKQPTNAGLQIVADRAPSSDAAGALRLRVSNAADSTRERFTIRFDAAHAAATTSLPRPLDIYVPLGESRTIATADLSAWLSATGNALALEGDDHPFDNRVFHAAAQPAEAVVVFIGDDDAKDTKGLRFYLDRAFPASDRLVTRIVALKPDGALPPGETDGASLFIVGASLPANRTEPLRRRAEAGATLLIVARDAGMGDTIHNLLDTTAMALTEADVKDYSMLSEVDFKHPLFAPFADPRFGDFTKIRFWKHRAISLGDKQPARVLMKFDDGSPALIETPIGKGRCLILAAGWHPSDGQLALSSKFVPLMNVLLQQSLGRPPTAARYTVGDTIDLAWIAQSPAFAGKTVRVTDPAGRTIALDTAGRVTQTDQPGFYNVEVGDTTLPIAVNLAAGESDTAPLPPEELEKRGVKLWQSTKEDPAAAAEQHRQMRIIELENRHKLWRWLLVAGLAVLIAETWLAGRFARGDGEAA